MSNDLNYSKCSNVYKTIYDIKSKTYVKTVKMNIYLVKSISIKKLYKKLISNINLWKHSKFSKVKNTSLFIDL